MESIRYYRVDLNRLASTLRGLLEHEKAVVLAILFGSALRRELVRDVDVAVYSSGTLDLGRLLALGSKLEESLGVPVDLVPLEYSPPALRVRILLDGWLLIARRLSEYSRLLKESLGDYSDLNIKIRRRV